MLYLGKEDLSFHNTIHMYKLCYQRYRDKGSSKDIYELLCYQTRTFEGSLYKRLYMLKYKDRHIILKSKGAHNKALSGYYQHINQFYLDIYKRMFL